MISCGFSFGMPTRGDGRGHLAMNIQQLPPQLWEHCVNCTQPSEPNKPTTAEAITDPCDLIVTQLLMNDQGPAVAEAERESVSSNKSHQEWPSFAARDQCLDMEKWFALFSFPLFFHRLGFCVKFTWDHGVSCQVMFSWMSLPCPPDGLEKYEMRHVTDI